METKHTPAQWKVLDNRNSTDRDKFGHYIVDDQGYIVADMPSYNNTKPSEANARLIAAAPELLEALQVLLKSHYKLSFELNGNINATLEEMMAESVINKATK